MEQFLNSRMKKTRQLHSSLTILKSHHDFVIQLFKDAVINDPEYANNVQELNDDLWKKFINDFTTAKRF